MSHRCAAGLDPPVLDAGGVPGDRIKLEGTWWTAWQTFNEGAEVIATQPVGLTQHGSTIQIEALERSSENGTRWLPLARRTPPLGRPGPDGLLRHFRRQRSV